MLDDTPARFPIRSHHCGEPIPDLSKIPEERWVEAVTPLSSRGREMAIDLARPRVDPLAIGTLILELPRPRAAGPDGRIAAMHAGTEMPRPGPLTVGDAVGAAAPKRRDSRQVGFRLTDEQYAELEAACAEFDLRPGQLARMLVHNGVRRVLYEARQREGS